MWDLFKKDMLRLAKQPTGFLFLIALPLVLTALMGFIFNNNQDAVLPSIKLIVEDHDDSFVSGMLKGAFAQGELNKMFDVSEVEKDAGRSIIEQDEAAALLIIPKGFSDSLLSISKTELILIKNPSLAFGPKIAEEVIQIFAEGADRLVHVGEQPLSLIRHEMETQDEMTDNTIAAVSVMFNQLFNKAGTLILNPPITLAKTSVSGSTEQASDSKIMFTILLSGIATMCLFFILNGLSVDFFREREQFTLYRILVSPTPAIHFMLSKQFYLFTAGLFSFIAVWGLAFAIFKIPIHAAQILPFTIILLITCSCATGIISLLYVLIRTRSQASAILPATIIIFALLGGGMIPLQSMPVFMKKLSVGSPIFWGVDGVQKVLVDNAGFSGITNHILILTGLSLLTIVAALFMQRRRVMP